MEFSGLSMPGKLLTVSEKKGSFPGHAAHPEGLRGLFLQHGKLVEYINEF